ncbi:hypothetical protein TNCT_200281 [Trichonephila clavata]|uniref:Uncharacterized protein n=1 Tax=Trichonephila clavata TaxID=2740835 RepID=A0A8X6HQK5_TRICU|nr:hypothetical protein TNCT_200281 [Trichonephila clavata]
MIFRAEIVCLNFTFLGDDECRHSMDCCFDSGVTKTTHVSSPVTIWSKKSSPSLWYRSRKVNALPKRWVLCKPVNIFETQREHNFR